MNEAVARPLEILRVTPTTLASMLGPLTDAWVRARPVAESWNPFEIIAHLIHGERTDWVVRARIILEHGEAKPFEPFERMSDLDRSATTFDMLTTFARLRERNITIIEGMDLDDAALSARGTHPELGPVTMEQLLNAWAVHDLAHIAQIAEVMARTKQRAVGPWRAYLPIVDRGEEPSG